MADQQKPATPEPATVLKDCRHGRMLFLKHDEYVGKSLDHYGEFSELEGNLFAQIVGPGHVVVEVGANIGAHTVRLARLVSPGGIVVAFEPQRVIFQLLCANVALNELFNVHTIQAAVAHEQGLIKLPPIDYRGTNNFGGIPMVNIADGDSVPAMTLDSFSLPSLRLLKVDAEGSEFDVLQGAKRTIARHRPMLYVENDRRKRSARLIALIEELGYNMWWDTPVLFNPDNFAGCKEDVFPRIVSVNLICVPKEAEGISIGRRPVAGPTDWWKRTAPGDESE